MVAAVSDTIALALIEQLVRSGLFDADDIDDLATKLDGSGNTDAGRMVRAAYVEALAPSHSDWRAEQRRARFEVVPGPDGGNAPT